MHKYIVLTAMLFIALFSVTVNSDNYTEGINIESVQLDEKSDVARPVSPLKENASDNLLLVMLYETRCDTNPIINSNSVQLVAGDRPIDKYYHFSI